MPWSHRFVCLAETDTECVPTDYTLLTANGLGKAKIHLFENIDTTDIHQAILLQFPKLHYTGGYELLRTHDNSKRLCVIKPPPEVYTGHYF